MARITTSESGSYGSTIAPSCATRRAWGTVFLFRGRPGRVQGRPKKGTPPLHPVEARLDFPPNPDKPSEEWRGGRGAEPYQVSGPTSVAIPVERVYRGLRGQRVGSGTVRDCKG